MKYTYDSDLVMFVFVLLAVYLGLGFQPASTEAFGVPETRLSVCLKRGFQSV